MAGLCGRMHASQPVNRMPTLPWTKMTSDTSPWTKLSHADLIGQFCPSWDSYVECTGSVYDANLPPWDKTVSPGGTKLSQRISLGQFCPPIESMRQIKIKHAAPHHAPGKLQTAGVMYTCWVFNNDHNDNEFLLTASPLPHKDRFPDVPFLLCLCLGTAF